MGQCEGASRGGGVSGSCRRVNRTLVSLILHRRNISLNAGSDLTIHLSVCLSVGCSTQLFDCIIRTVARQSITWRVTSLGASWRQSVPRGPMQQTQLNCRRLNADSRQTGPHNTRTLSTRYNSTYMHTTASFCTRKQDYRVGQLKWGQLTLLMETFECIGKIQ